MSLTPSTLASLLLATTLMAFVSSTPARAAEIHVMSGGAPKEALAILIPRFEAKTGHHVAMTYEVISALKKKLADGATPDAVLMPLRDIADLDAAAPPRLVDRVAIGTVRLVAIVGKDRPRPDISTPATFRAALLAARSIVVSTPTATPSGAHMARVFVDLGIAEAVSGKVIHRPALDGGAAMVASGSAEIGIYPSSEVIHVEGVVPAGPLPEASQLAILYGAAATAGPAGAPANDPARAFVRFLVAPENRHVWTEAGFDPP